MKEFFIRRYRIESTQPDARRAMIRVDDSGLITYVDNQVEHVLGYDPSELVGQPVMRIVADREDDPLSPGNRQRFDEGESVLLTLRHRDGFFFTAQMTLRLAVRDADQAASAFITLRDSTPLSPRLAQLAEDTGELGIWELDIRDNRMIWSEGVYRVLELRPGAEITPEQAIFYCQGAQARLRALFRRCIRTGQPFDLTLDLITARQHHRHVQLQGRALKTGLQVVGVGGVLVDHTARQVLDRARIRATNVLHGVMAATDDLVLAVDPDLNLLHFNEAFRVQALHTYNVEPVEGANLNDLLADFPNERRLAQGLWQRALEKDSFVVEIPLAQQDRDLPIYEIHYRRLLDSKGELLGAVQVAKDISERVKGSDNRHYLSRHDPVTGLLNRREFAARLKRLLINSRSTPGSHALLYFTMNKAAEINEHENNGGFDRYLRALAGELTLKVRQRDSLARLGSDTFALLIENCNRQEASKVADNLLAFVAGFVFEWKNQPLQTSTSAGLLRLTEDTPTDAERLLAQAADLCETAAAASRSRLHAADAVSGGREEGLSRQKLETLRDCLDNDRLSLYYHSLRPVASITWGDHIEILARLQPEDPASPLMQPGEFLPVAERFGLAGDIDRAVIRKTMAWFGRHSLLEPRLKYCGFNLSLASVLDDSFPDFVGELLKTSSYAPECFCFEVQEKTATQYPDEVAVLCNALHRIGCRVALDGAGASIQSYSLAARLPVDIIKLDEAMMAHLHDDPVQQVMVEALHRIAEAAGKHTVATFIENDDALRKVRGLAIHYGQGFRLSRPRPLKDLRPVAVELDTGRIGGLQD
ncbi:EAL domain-containing protein [Marinobacter sp.]|uniref:EAL domain-containing protein n=1 Tax=Marinobacter sp. TaxID=50741 RepID=UPI003850B786